MTTHRKLAAILSADAVGYSRLMADDEAEILRAPIRFALQTFTPRGVRTRISV